MDGFPTISKLSANRRPASNRAMKNVTIKVRLIYVGMATNSTGSFSVLILTNIFRGKSSITIRTISTVSI